MATIEVKQRAPIAKPDPLADWHKGDIIMIDGTPYIVSSVGGGLYAPVSLTDGNIWCMPREEGKAFVRPPSCRDALLLKDATITITHS